MKGLTLGTAAWQVLARFARAIARKAELAGRCESGPGIPTVRVPGMTHNTIAILAERSKSAAKRRANLALDAVATKFFARRYYRDPEGTWLNTTWLGQRIWKLPSDMWVYQELIHRLRPDLIIETGTAEGGSALYMASLMDLLGHGRIITIDVEGFDGRPQHPRIEYVLGSSTDPTVLAPVLAAASESETVMVILDSDHSRDHVLAELHLLSRAVTPGSYLIVEDGNVNGHPVYRDHGPGPTEALKAWLPGYPEFAHDPRCDRHMHTFNPGGYLLRS